MKTLKLYFLFGPLACLLMSLTGCVLEKETVRHVEVPAQERLPIDGQSEGGYSGGGGDVNAYNSDEFRAVFVEAVEYARNQHRSVPFFLMFLRFDNKLPEEFEDILHRAMSVGEGNIGVIQNIEIKFNDYCQSGTRGSSHGSVDYSLESTVCISSRDLKLMSKLELKRKLLALVAHEYLHMLGIKSENLAYRYQNMIYNNHHIIDGGFLGTSYRATLKALYESTYYFMYRDCVLDSLCSAKLEFSYTRQFDLVREKSKREELIKILDQIEVQIQSLGIAYRHYYFSLTESFIDPSIWPTSAEFNYSDYRGFAELTNLKAYLSNNEIIEDNTLQRLSLEFVKRVFQLNFIDRVSQLGLVSQALFFNYCFRPAPIEVPETAEILDSYFEEHDFGHAKIDAYLAGYDIQTIWFGSEVIFLPQSRMCSVKDLSIPARQGPPKELIPDNTVSLRKWILDYSLPYEAVVPGARLSE